MADYLNRTTPGVYINEIPAFPSSIVGVETAVPAFIGYTEKAEIEGKQVSLVPIKISSLSEYEQIFGKGYMPFYKITSAGQESYDFTAADPDNNAINYYNLVQTPNFKFNLYYSLKLFYENGGGTCYIVSVGDFDHNVNKDDLIKGLTAVAGQAGTTMLVIPDAVLLPGNSDYTVVVQTMLNQCGELGDRFAILDVYGADSVVDQNSLDTVITQFQTGLGDRSLSYGAGYFPFLNSIVVATGDFNYFDLALNDPPTLTTFQSLLKWDNKSVNGSGATYDTINTTISKIGPDNNAQEIADYSKIFSNLPILHTILNVIISNNSVLSPSGAVAGIYAYTDINKGVWNAPANISLNSVTNTTFKLNDIQQSSLNIPPNGKSVNAIRDFVGRGSVIWGARTFEGNSFDFKYIQVRRSIIYIEQSIKTALGQFVFAANDSQTWVTVTSMISNFLTGVWAQGGLMGDKASDAFTVQCGLGSTMTSQDILDGYMTVQVTLQMIRPAEFIELTFKQKMEGV